MVENPWWWIRRADPALVRNLLLNYPALSSWLKTGLYTPYMTQYSHVAARTGRNFQNDIMNITDFNDVDETLIKRYTLFAIDQFYRYAAAHQISLIFVQLPVMPDYRLSVPAKTSALFNRTMHELTRYDNIQIIDLSQMNLTKAAFKDFIHLNATGQRLVSEELYRQLKLRETAQQLHTSLPWQQQQTVLADN